MRANVHVALLRGINVGGKNKLAMKELTAIFERAGCEEVRSYIQSGNVVFTAPAALARKIPGLISAAIAKQFGYKVPVVLRRGRALQRIVEGNPFLRPAIDPRQLHVAFLADKPSAAQLRTLDPDRSPPDAFELRGSEVYLRCPHGVARTKLTNAYFDSRLDTVSTMRNWATVLRLLELADSKSDSR